MSTVLSPGKIPLPDVTQVRELLGMIFDGMMVKVGGKTDVSPASKSYVGVYVTDNDTTVALVACDLAFAANSGAALSMLPPNVAKEAAKSGALTDVMVANLREVMNICTRLVLREDSPHVRLTTLCQAGKLPAPAAAIAAGAKARADFEITLAKYGPGQLVVLTG
jgi:hypothetical protein